MNGRKLSIMQVNDNPDGHRIIEDYFTFFQSHRITSIFDAQELLIDHNQIKVDIFILDVNFDTREETDHPKNLTWVHDKIRPYGPLLALPFLKQNRNAIFIPFSNYWKHESIINNGDLIISLSMLVANQKRKLVTLNEIQDMIRDSSFSNEINMAINRGLSNYRKNIFYSSLPQIIDLNKSKNRLIEILEHISDGFSYQMPLQDAEGIISIGIASENEIDWIQISSFFGDFLNFRKEANKNDIEKIIEWIDESISTSEEKKFIENGEHIYRLSCKLIKALEQDNSTFNEERNRISEENNINKYLLTRIVIEFSWIKAWHIKNKCPSLKKTVYSTLNLLVDPATRYKRLLTGNGKDIKKQPWYRAPFNECTNVMDAYSLDKGSSKITPFEKALCAQFAKFELGWENNSNSPYPPWMCD